MEDGVLTETGEWSVQETPSPSQRSRQRKKRFLGVYHRDDDTVTSPPNKGYVQGSKLELKSKGNKENRSDALNRLISRRNRRDKFSSLYYSSSEDEAEKIPVPSRRLSTSLLQDTSGSESESPDSAKSAESDVFGADDDMCNLSIRPREFLKLKPKGLPGGSKKDPLRRSGSFGDERYSFAETNRRNLGLRTRSDSDIYDMELPDLQEKTEAGSRPEMNGIKDESDLTDGSAIQKSPKLKLPGNFYKKKYPHFFSSSANATSKSPEATGTVSRLSLLSSSSSGSDSEEDMAQDEFLEDGANDATSQGQKLENMPLGNLIKKRKVSSKLENIAKKFKSDTSDIFVNSELDLDCEKFSSTYKNGHIASSKFLSSKSSSASSNSCHEKSTERLQRDVSSTSPNKFTIAQSESRSPTFSKQLSRKNSVERSPHSPSTISFKESETKSPTFPRHFSPEKDSKSNAVQNDPESPRKFSFTKSASRSPSPRHFSSDTDSRGKPTNDDSRATQRPFSFSKSDSRSPTFYRHVSPSRGTNDVSMNDAVIMSPCKFSFAESDSRSPIFSRNERQAKSPVSPNRFSFSQSNSRTEQLSPGKEKSPTTSKFSFAQCNSRSPLSKQLSPGKDITPTTSKFSFAQCNSRSPLSKQLSPIEHMSPTTSKFSFAQCNSRSPLSKQLSPCDAKSPTRSKFSFEQSNSQSLASSNNFSPNKERDVDPNKHSPMSPALSGHFSPGKYPRSKNTHEDVEISRRRFSFTKSNPASPMNSQSTSSQRSPTLGQASSSNEFADMDTDLPIITSPRKKTARNAPVQSQPSDSDSDDSFWKISLPSKKGGKPKTTSSPSSRHQFVFDEETAKPSLPTKLKDANFMGARSGNGNEYMKEKERYPIANGAKPKLNRFQDNVTPSCSGHKDNLDVDPVRMSASSASRRDLERNEPLDPLDEGIQFTDEALRKQLQDIFGDDSDHETDWQPVNKKSKMAGASRKGKKKKLPESSTFGAGKTKSKGTSKKKSELGLESDNSSDLDQVLCNLVADFGATPKSRSPSSKHNFDRRPQSSTSNSNEPVFKSTTSSNDKTSQNSARSKARTSSVSSFPEPGSSSRERQYNSKGLLCDRPSELQPKSVTLSSPPKLISGSHLKPKRRCRRSVSNGSVVYIDDSDSESSNDSVIHVPKSRESGRNERGLVRRSRDMQEEFHWDDVMETGLDHMLLEEFQEELTPAKPKKLLNQRRGQASQNEDLVVEVTVDDSIQREMQNTRFPKQTKNSKYANEGARNHFSHSSQNTNRFGSNRYPQYSEGQTSPDHRRLVRSVDSPVHSSEFQSASQRHGQSNRGGPSSPNSGHRLSGPAGASRKYKSAARPQSMQIDEEDESNCVEILDIPRNFSSNFVRNPRFNVGASQSSNTDGNARSNVTVPSPRAAAKSALKGRGKKVRITPVMEEHSLHEFPPSRPSPVIPFVPTSPALQSSPGRARNSRSRQRSSRGSANRPGDPDPVMVVQQLEDDEAMAKRLQEEMDMEFAQALMREEQSAYTAQEAHESQRLMEASYISPPPIQVPVPRVYPPPSMDFNPGGIVPTALPKTPPNRGRRRMTRSQMGAAESVAMNRSAMYSIHVAMGMGLIEPGRRPNISPPAVRGNRRGRGRRRGTGAATNDASQGNDYEALLALGEIIGEAKPKGLTKSLIEQLPTKVYHKTETSSKDDECSVCMGDYEEGETLRILPCFHNFHVKCIDKWIKDNATCPICRVPIRLT